MILLEFELNSLISLFIFDSTYTVLIRNVNVLIKNLFEFKGDMHLLHNKQEVVEVKGE